MLINKTCDSRRVEVFLAYETRDWQLSNSDASSGYLLK